MSTGHLRITLSEYGSFRSITTDAHVLGIRPEDFPPILRRCLTQATGVSHFHEALQVRGDEYRLTGICGLFTVAPGVEFEITPKFLVPDAPNWQDDLVTVALLGRYGHLIGTDAVSAGMSHIRTVSDALGITLARLIARNLKKPIRTYLSVHWRDYVIDGELDPESYWDFDEFGFQQTGLALSRDNPWNATISAALDELCLEVSSSDLANKLRALSTILGAAKGPPLRRMRIPARHRQWSTSYDLAASIIRGSGLSFTTASDYFLPGFLMRSSEAWEDFLGNMLRLSSRRFGLARGAIPLGQRGLPRDEGSWKSFSVTPDFRLTDEEGNHIALADAKYRTRIDENGEERLAIAAGDLYEMMAFLEAADCDVGFLIYPTTSATARDCGAWKIFEQVVIGDQSIYGVGISIAGISKPKGIQAFAHGLADAIEQPWAA